MYDGGKGEIVNIGVNGDEISKVVIRLLCVIASDIET